MIYVSKLKTAPEVESYHVLDMVVENCQNDLWLFDNVIETDFVEAYEDAGILTEAEKVEKYRESKIEAIVEKIKNIFTKLISTISAFLDKWITKLTDFFKKDAGLYEKYKDRFEKNITFIKTKYRPMNTAVLDMDMDPNRLLSEDSDFMHHYIEIIGNIASIKDQDRLETIETQWNNALKDQDPEKQAEHLVYESDEEAEYNITDRDAGVIGEFMKDGHKVLDQAKKFKKRMDSYFKNVEKNVTNTISTFKLADRVTKDDYSMIIAGYHLIDNITISLSSYVSRFCSSLVQNLTSALKQTRRIFMMAVNYSEAQTEQTYAIGLASDLYVESALTVFD